MGFLGSSQKFQKVTKSYKVLQSTARWIIQLPRDLLESCESHQSHTQAEIKQNQPEIKPDLIKINQNQIKIQPKSNQNQNQNQNLIKIKIYIKIKSNQNRSKIQAKILREILGKSKTSYGNPMEILGNPCARRLPPCSGGPGAPRHRAACLRGSRDPWGGGPGRGTPGGEAEVTIEP